MNAALHNEEFTEEELKEMAIFLTQYVGFPLGSRLDGSSDKVAGKRKKAGERVRPKTRRPTSTRPSR